MKKPNYREAMEQLKQQAPLAYEMMKAIGIPDKVRGFEVFQDADINPFMIHFPQRATSKSAGYDIRAYGDYVIWPNEMMAIETGLTAYMKEDEFLDLRIRSGLAYQHWLTLQNDAGVVDADYYGKHIKVMIRNEGISPVTIKHGDRIAQGIFSKYLLTDDDQPVKDEREGGLGSTGVK